MTDTDRYNPEVAERYIIDSISRTDLLVTEDRLVLCLRDYRDDIHRSINENKKALALRGTGTCAVTLFLALMTASFHDVFFIKAHVIEDAAWIAFLYFAVKTVFLYVNKVTDKRKEPSPEDVIDKIKEMAQKDSERLKGIPL